MVAFIFLGFVHDVLGFILILLLFSFAASCTRGPLTAKITLSISPKEMGKINGVSSSLDSLARVVGPLIAGFIIGAYGHFWLGLLMAAVALVAFVMNLKDIKPYTYRIQKKDN